MIREIADGERNALLLLYSQLHDNPVPAESEALAALWNRILQDQNHHIIVAESDGTIVSSCVLVLVPNLTHGQRPYALVENVVTDKAHRGRGYATECLLFAADLARKDGCYKIMLLTGSKEEATLRFYERAGFNREDKTGFVHWL
jgi:GNAT superfamily N-acetyltransferase